jgi:hypothetical protein
MHWLVDAAVGGIAALSAITVAKAALPDHPVAPPAPVAAAPAVTAAPAAAAPTPEPVQLIAFQEPVPGHEVVSPFGLRQLPWEAGGRLHAGVDIAAPKGAPVVTAADGVVSRAGESPTYGRFVEVKHAEGLTTLYAHMAAIAPQVRSGSAVKAGAAVGRIGSSGTSTGPHLHFEIRDAKERPMNPALFLGRQFAEAGDLPLRAARRVPSRVRLAHVSRIPASKRGLMQAKLEAKQARSAADAAQNASAATSDGATGEGVTVLHLEGRPRATLTL